jgi:hypothetical protein
VTEMEKIDLIRERTDLGYREAKKLLDEAGGDVVQALARHEEKESQWQETIQVKGGEILDTVRELIKEGNVTKIRVKHEGKTIVELPVTIGAAGILIAPQLAALGALAALVTRCTLEIERPRPALDKDSKEKEQSEI